MSDFIKKIPKKILIPVTILVLVMGLITGILLNIESIIENISKKYINGELKIENIDLSLKNTKIKNIKLYDETNNIVVDFPEIDVLNLSKSFFTFRIDEVDVKSGKIFINRDKEGNLNIQKLLKKEKKVNKIEKEKKSVVEDKKKDKIYKAKSLPINLIKISDIEINYRDEKFEPILERKIDNININIKSNKEDGIDASLNTESDYLKLEALYKNKEEPVNIDLKIKKFVLDKELLKSLINNDKIDNSDIDVQADLSIKSNRKIDNTKIFGNFNLNMPYLNYSDLTTNIKNINLYADFLGEDGEIKLSLNAFNKDKDFVVTYKDKELNSTISFDKINEEILNSFIPIKNKKLDLSKVNIEDIKTDIHYSESKGFLINMTMQPNYSKYKGLELDEFSLNFKSKDSINEINGDFLTKIKNTEEKIKLNLKNNQQNTDILFSLISKDKNALLPNINLNSNIKNLDDKLEIDIVSNIIKFKVDYKKKAQEIKFYGDKFEVNYNVKDKKIVDGQGRIPFEIYNLTNYLEFLVKDNEIKIKELNMKDKSDSTKTFIMSGETDLNTKEIKFDYIGENIQIKRNIEDKKIELNFSGEGKIEGNVNNIISNGKIENVSLEYLGKINKIKGNYKFSKNYKDIKASFIGGIEDIAYENYSLKNFKIDIDFFNNELNIKNLSNNNILLKGKYDLKEKNVNAVAEIKKLTNQDINLDKVNFSLENFKGNLKGATNNPSANINLGKTVIDLGKGKILKLDGDINLINQIVNIKHINFKDKENNELFSLFGKVDLSKKIIAIKNKKNTLDLETLQDFINNKDIMGKFDVDLSVDGDLKNPNYKLKLASNEIKYKNIPTKNIIISILGDTKNIKLEDFKIDFYGNIMSAIGAYDIRNKKYSADIKSIDKFKIEKIRPLINSLLKGSNADILEKLEGGIDIVVHIDEKTKKAGIELKDIKLSFPKYYLDMNNVVGKIEYIDNSLFVEDLSAKINNAPLKLKGSINLENIKSIEKEKLLQDLPYKFVLSLNNFNYEYPKVVKLKINSDMVISNEELTGNIILKEGYLYDIPNDYKSIFSIVKNRVSKKKNKKEELIKTKTVEKQSKNTKDKQKIFKMLMPIDFTVSTEKPFKIDMDNFNIVVPELYGDLELDLLFKGRDEKYYIEGETELKNGYMFVNTNEFIIDRALVVFNKNTELPKINPNIFFETNVNMDDADYRFEIFGQSDKLRYNISSKNGTTGGDLSSLIKNPNSDKDIYVQGSGNEIFLNFMKNLIAGQIVETVLGPSTKFVKRKLDLTRLIVKPEVKVYDTDKNLSVNNKEITKDNSVDRRGRNNQIYSVDLKLEAKDNIYKEKLFWFAKARVLGTGKDVVNQTMKIESKMREYDVGFEYKIDSNKTVEVGVGTVPNKFRTDEDKDYRKTNYHIGYKIRKRYNSFSEIFSF